MNDLSPDGRLLGNDTDAWCKPDAIPDDVMKAAEAAFAGHGRAGEFEETRQIRDNIARAIMAERERCAQIVETRGKALVYNDSLTSIAVGVNRAAVCSGIVAAIRKGEA
jgi:hypothetical protein